MTPKGADRGWVRDLLDARGYKQRDLARLWGCSEAAVSRFLAGLDSGDMPLSRAYPLSRMLGMDLEELVARMGFAGETVNLPPVSVTTGAPPLPTYSITPHDGRLRVLIHLDLAPEAAGDLMKVLATATATTVTKGLLAKT